MLHSYTIGIDFGTDSVRSILVNSLNGEVLASSVFHYPRWKAGLYCNLARQQFRQHPKDYLEGLIHTVQDCVAQVSPAARNSVKALSVAATGSTPVAVDAAGMPLALADVFEENPNAMFVLWKDHCATAEAMEINEHASNYAERHGINYLQYVGGIYSSEWFWAKWLNILRTDKQIAAACHGFVEHCDWIPFLLTGGNRLSQVRRSRCAAGHKALWAEEFNGMPSQDFFTSLDDRFKGFSDNLFTTTYTSDQSAGTISAEWAKQLGLPANTLIGIGAFDAHMGAVGGQIEPYYLSKVMGTSTCDMLIVPQAELKDKSIKGICGQVNGSVVPGMIGLEAGQSAFGDAYAWFRKLITWPVDHMLSVTTSNVGTLLDDIKQSVHDNILIELAQQAATLSFNKESELATDWLNGRRTPDANQLLKAALTNLNLASDAPHIFRAIVEATCFGAKAIIECFTKQGVPIKGLIGLGGVAKKSPYVMQILADITQMPIRIHKSDQTCAAGAAMFAATVAGIHDTVEEAMKAMGQGFEKTYKPESKYIEVFNHRYLRYKQLGHFLEQGL